MSLRARLTLASALAVAVAIAIASVFVYITVRNQQRGSIDDSLRARMTQLRGAFSVESNPFTGRPVITVDDPSPRRSGRLLPVRRRQRPHVAAPDRERRPAGDASTCGRWPPDRRPRS